MPRPKPPKLDSSAPARSTNRRAFLRRLAAAGAAGATADALLSACSDPEPSQARPNILLIVADDLGIDAIGAYGCRAFQTPRIDRLAAEGVRFETCYATPLCVPSRVELLTGLYPFRSGWVDNISFEGLESIAPEKRYLDPNLGTFAQALRDAGYATAVAGKWQLCHFEERPKHVRECGFDRFCCWMWKIEDRISPRYWDPCIYRDGKVKLAVKDRYAPDLYTDYLIDFMREHRDQPFLAFYPMALPHPHFHPTPDQVHDDPTIDRTRDDLENFPSMVRYLDKLVGRLVDEIDALGLSDRTLVLFTTDNGTPDMLRERFLGVTGGGKGAFDESGMRVPLIARQPGAVAAGRVSRALVDFSDFYPTLCGLGSTSALGARDGRSFAGALHQADAAGREWIFSQLGDQRCVRDARFKLYDDGRLFDIVDDPEESRSLAAAADHDEVRRRLQTALDGLR